MRLTPPSFMVFLLSLVLFGGGVAAHYHLAPQIDPYEFYLLAAGYVVLAAGALFKGV